MEVREARIRDHDELLQIIARSQLRCPALAQVPSRDEGQTEYALASLIRQQGPQDKVFVAQSRGQLLGCMAVTSLVDVSPLQQNINLQVYDQLMQPDVYEAALAAHGQQAAAEAAETDSAGDGAPATQQFAGADKWLLQALQQGDTAPNAFAMTMLSCDPESQQQAASSALLAAAFDAFPDKDYCLLTLPPDSPEVPLLATFTRLLPLPCSALVEVLYLCHRFALLEDLRVQPGERAHVEGVQDLLTGTADMAPNMAAFTAAMEANRAFVMSCEGQVVGMAATQPLTDLSQLQRNFHTASMPGLSQDKAADKCIVQLTALCMNPIFVHRTRQVLLDILRRCKASMLLFLLQPDQAPPDGLTVFRQVAPRHQVVQTADSTEAGFALFAFCPDLPSRTAVNSHIVVAGASDCGLSVIETLLLHERLHFTAVTLLAPTGVVTPPPDAHYTAGLLKRLGIHATVNVLYVELDRIDNEEQCIILPDKRKVQYGLLLLAVGLDRSDALLHQLVQDNCNVISAQTLPGSMPRGIAEMDSIVVCGPAFEAFTALGQLEAAGVSVSKVKHLAPAGPEPALSALLREAANQAGVTLPETIQVTDIAGHAAEEDGRTELTATLQDSSTFSQAVDLVVVAGGVDRAQVPQCIEQAGEVGALVCDGRLVVDAAFRTNDPKIFAAGTVATFSCRYGSSLSHSLYNSMEVGQRAGGSIAAAFSSPFLGDSALPKLSCGRMAATPLPGGGHFLCACAAGAQAPHSVDSQGGRAIVSNTQEGYCQLMLDSANCLQSAIFCTSKPNPSLPSAMLLPLVGLPMTYLQPLQHARETGTQADPQESLKQPWTGLLYHESFPQLRSSLIVELLNSGQPLQELDSNSVAVNSEAAIAHVQTEVMDHVKQLGPVEFPHYVSVSVA